jgi:hypothetical protein
MRVRLERWVRERGPRLLTAAALTWAVGWIAGLFLAPDTLFGGRFIDAGTYYGAGLAYRQGADLFSGVAFRQWPLVAALWSPLTLLARPIAFRLWLLLLLVGVAVGFVSLLSRQEREPGGAPFGRLVVLFLGPPTLIMLYLGQMSGLCFAAYAVGLRLLPRHPRLAGCCFAVIAAKPNLALIALPALIAAPPSATLAFVLAALIWPVGSVLVSGPATLLDFLGRVYAVRDSTLDLVSSSLGSLLPLQGTPHALVQFALLGGLACLLAWLCWRRWRRGTLLTPAGVDLAAVVTLLALPYALVSDLLFVAPLLLRLFTLPGRSTPALFTAWWLGPWLAALFAHSGGGGLAALLPPLAALVGWRLLGERWQMRPPTALVATPPDSGSPPA